MERMAKCGNKRVDSHACRNLHNLIRRKGKILPVHVSFLEMQERMSCKKLNMVPVAHPIVRLSDWARVSFKAGGHFFPLEEIRLQMLPLLVWSFRSFGATSEQPTLIFLCRMPTRGHGTYQSQFMEMRVGAVQSNLF